MATKSKGASPDPPDKGAEKEAPRPSPSKTPRERQEEQRQAKLDAVQEQIESGSLVIRKMTKEERKKFPPREPKPKKRY
jgi:hypothetical protein